METTEAEVLDEMCKQFVEVDDCFNFIMSNPENAKLYVLKGKHAMQKFITLQLKQLELAQKRTKQEMELSLMTSVTLR